ncbi:MAG: SMP-30/gluconolactonase/LRE family protein [Acidobacteria bacterium]|nr:SMP-30/gluconolactonase/LRE family protein [Acidobacteriota bacterium]
MAIWKKYVAATVVLACVFVAGCGSSGTSVSDAAPEPPTPGGPLVTGGATTMYVVQNNTYITGSLNSSAADVVMSFPTSANGSVGATSTLTTPVGMFVSDVKTDAAGNLYVGGMDIASGSGEVLVYPAGATGSAAPARTIMGSLTGLKLIQGLALDTTGQMYVSSWVNNGAAANSISVFASNANGNVAPVRTISGGATGLTSPAGLAVDSAGTVYVADGYLGRVSAFTSTQNGDVAPARSFTTLYAPFQIAIDSANNLYLPLADTTGNYGAVNVFPSTASGNLPTPTRVVGGHALNAQGGIYGIALDSRNNLYCVYSPSSSTSLGAIGIATFSPTASGNASPATVVTSSNFTLSYFGYITVR